MARDRCLAAVSGAQLGAGVIGLGIAVRRRHPYDFLVLHGSPDHVARDTLLMGTALSAPVYMLGAQAVATARLARAGDERARRVLAALGTAMVFGYLGESLVRSRLRRSGRDRLETPLAVAGIALAAAMAVLGAMPDLR